MDWPPGSPDIMSMVFFLWGYMKDRICATKVLDLPAKIAEALGTIITDMLQQT
jgi:hypothetical protein